MTYELTGKLIAIYDTVQRTETFKTREFAVEITEEINGKPYTNYAKFQCVQARVGIVDSVTIGEQVKVYFNIKGSKWEKDGKVNYMTNLDAWKIEVIGQVARPAVESMEGFGEQHTEDVPDLTDDSGGRLPF